MDNHVAALLDGMDAPTSNRHRCAKVEACTPPKREGVSEMMVTTIGLDLAKNVFQFHGADAAGIPLLRKQQYRARMAEFFAQHPPCVVAMEAFGGAPHWGLKLRPLGHQVRLIVPQYVKPFLKSQKNNAADAAAICEAGYNIRWLLRVIAMKALGHLLCLAQTLIMAALVAKWFAIKGPKPEQSSYQRWALV